MLVRAYTGSYGLHVPLASTPHGGEGKDGHIGALWAGWQFVGVGPRGGLQKIGEGEGWVLPAVPARNFCGLRFNWGPLATKR